VDELIQELIELVKAATPMLWAAARQAVIAELIEDIATIVFCSILVWGCIRVGRWALSRLNKDDLDTAGLMAIGIAGLLTAISAIAIIMAVEEMIHLLLAPDYNAIRMLLELVTCP
jgi:hypothetical protein